MIFQLVNIDLSIFNDENVEKFQATLQTLRHLYKLAPLFTLVNDGLAILKDDAKWSNVKSIIRVDLAGFGPVSVYGEELSLKLLDDGVQTIYYHDLPIQDVMENNDCSLNANIIEQNIHVHQILASFPRSRQGMILDTSAANLSHHSILGAINKYRDHLAHIAIQVHTMEQITPLVTAIHSYLSAFSSSSTAASSSSLDVYLLLPNLPYTLADMKAWYGKHERLHLVLLSTIHPTRFQQTLPSPTSHLQPNIVIQTPPSVDGVADLLDYYTHCIKNDRPDGLITTVVCDTSSICLGLVYSSQESIIQSFLEEKGIYYSRSRQGLWSKGDSSGMSQLLVTMRLDCDSDALRFTVHQLSGSGASSSVAPTANGAFCHLMHRTCWGPASGLLALQHTLQDRFLSAPEGSYTKRLFSDQDLLRKKLLEEVQELVEAETKDHIAAEAADVFYFMMVRCIQAGVTIEDIENQLNWRHRKISRRPGNAKDWRTRDAEKVLNAAAAASGASSGEEVTKVSEESNAQK